MIPCHKLNGLKQHTYSQFWRPDVEDEGVGSTPSSSIPLPLQLLVAAP